MTKNLFFLCLLWSVSVFAQNAGKISGRVVDAKTQEPIPSANLVVVGTTMGAASDLDGYFFILNIAPGTYELRASIVGYREIIKKNVIVHMSRTTTVDFALEETAIEQKAVEIFAVRPDVEKEKTSTSDIVRTDEMIAVPGMRSISDVLALSADVVDGHFRGGRDGEELYNLSGMGIMNPLNSSLAFAPIMSAVEEVEVITSGFSAQYGNAQSGVINISMKEGRSNRWQARADVRARLPGYKHFGANVFDESANPYLSMLNTDEKWRGNDPTTNGLNPYWSTISYGINRYLDTIQVSQIAYALWKQANRDLNRNYSNLWDYSVEANAGGPLSKSARLFLATRIENRWPIIPTPGPNINRQVMGNIVQDLGPFTFRLSGAYSGRRGYDLNGVNSSGYSGFWDWLLDRVIGVQQLKEDNMQVGLRSVYVWSNSTLLDVKVNMLQTKYVDGARIVSPSRYTSDDKRDALWSDYTVPNLAPVVGEMQNDFRDERTRTISVDASITSQTSNAHMLLAGAQVNFYKIDVNDNTSLSSLASSKNEIFLAKPFELGLYIQDKIEFQGLIANVGFRFDLYNQNVNYYVDQFSPVRYIDSMGVHYDPNLAAKQRTPTIGRFQPRIGISFPVSEFTVFHLNYGSFFQRPSFERTVYLQLPRSGNFNGVTLGNPRLKPEETKSYDVGVTQALGVGFTLDVSGYYKDVNNLLEQAIYYDEGGQQYMTFVNRDYADIRGFHVTLSKRKGMLTGSLKYNYSVATGKSSTGFNATPVYRENPGEGQLAVELPNPRDILLDFDRTHNLTLNLILATEDSWGPHLGDIYPLEHVSVAVTSFMRSGRPYTYDTQGLGLLNNHRSPNEYSTDLKISRKISDFFGQSATFYIEVLNLFNQKIFSYNSVFQTLTTSGKASTGALNNNILNYETNPDLLRWYTINAPFLVDQGFLIYANSPRSMYIGLALDF